MQSVKVAKNKLVEALTANRATHVQQYEAALEGYYEQAAKEVRRLARRVKDREEDGDLSIFLRKPISYESSYTTALEMLMWEENDYVTISQGEFTQYIQDAWAWKQGFAETNSTYSR